MIRCIPITKFFFLLLFLGSTKVFGAPVNTPHFGGGMAWQTGYISLFEKGSNNRATGFITGVGGRLHFYVKPNFRVGGTGASTKLTYTSNNIKDNYYALGYGGITLEGVIPLSFFTISLGTLIGGGHSTSLIILAKNGTSITDAEYFEKSTFIISPLLTVEYKLTKAISLMLLGDYLFGTHIGSGTSLGGAKIHFGVLFNK